MRIEEFSQKTSAVIVHVLRWFFTNQVTSKYVTGDGIANLADVQLYPPAKRLNVISPTNPIESARVIFCPSHEIDRMFSEYQNKIKAEILIFGNSDHDFSEFLWPIPSTVKKVFLQNSFISNDFFHTLPIGIENLRYGKNGLPILFSKLFSRIPKRNQILVGPFSDTHPERVKLNDLHGDIFKVHRKRLSPLGLSWQIATSKFVAVPRGNGVDTHRLWEVLYRGSIPVMLRNAWSESLIQLNFPIVLVDDWSNTCVIEGIKTHSFKMFNPEDIQVLWLSYWNNVFEINEF